MHAGEKFVLTVEEIVGSPERVSVSFKDLPGVVKRGHRLLLSDGLVQLTVERVAGREVHCKVSVGGELWREHVPTHSPSALEVTESE